MLQWKADPKSPLWNEYGIRLMLPKAGQPASNTRELTANPAEWMPWNYRQTLALPGI